MTFANPLALLWGLLAVPIVILYLRRTGLRREPVATSMIWQQVFAAEQARAAWQRWRHRVSLAVQLLILALVVVAMADPQIPAPRRIALILDNSASMNVADAQPTRLARAKEAAGRLIAGLGAHDQVAILSAGGAVGVRCGPTDDRAVLLAVLESLPATDGPTKVHAAVTLARRILGNESRGRICVLTDACFDGAAELAAADDVEMIRIGQRTGNVAATRLQARRSIAQPRTCQVLAEVKNFSDQPVECRLEVQLDGKPVPVILAGKSVDKPLIKLARNGDRADQWKRVFEIDAPEAAELTLRLDRKDAYPIDNEASLQVPSTGDLPSDTVADVELLAIDGDGRSESDLRSPAEVGTEITDLVAGRPGPAPWPYLAGVGVVLLALEWCLYQRRWIC